MPRLVHRKASDKVVDLEFVNQVIDKLNEIGDMLDAMTMQAYYVCSCGRKYELLGDKFRCMGTHPND